MNNEWRYEKSQGMKKVTTIIMNKKMSVVTTLQLFLTYVSVHTDVLILPCADSCLEQPACHTIAKYWSTQQPLWLLSTHTLHTPTLTCTHTLIKGVLTQGQSPLCTPLLQAHLHTYTHSKHYHSNGYSCDSSGPRQSQPPSSWSPPISTIREGKVIIILCRVKCQQ